MKVIKIPQGTMFITIDGEGVCDFCEKEVVGELTRFHKIGDACKNCFDKCMVNKSDTGEV